MAGTISLERQVIHRLETLGWTRTQYAAAMKCSRTMVWYDLQAGGMGNIGLRRLRRIAKTLGMKPVVYLVPKN